MYGTQKLFQCVLVHKLLNLNDFYANYFMNETLKSSDFLFTVDMDNFARIN